MSNIVNMPPTPTQNASTVRTRKRIREAFLTLAETTDFADINVNMLTKSAGLNRTTFYLHYQTLDDLSESIVSGLLDELGEGGRLLAAGVSKDDPGGHDSYFRTIGSRSKLFHRLLTSPGSSPLSSRLIEMHASATLAIWEQYGHNLDVNPESWQVRAQYAAGGVYYVTVHWLEAGMVESIESVCERVLEMALLVGRAERTMDPRV